MNEPETETTTGELEEASPTPRRRVRRWLVVAGAAMGGFVLGLLMAAGGAPDDPPAESGQAATGGDVAAGEQPWASGQETPHDGDDAAEAIADEQGAGGHAPGDGHEHGPAPDGWREAAEGFGQTFTQTGLGQDAWYTAVSSWMTPAQAEQYAQVPVEHIPTGTLVDVEVADPGGALFTAGRLTYDTGLVLEVGLTYDATSTGWLIATVAPAATE